MTGSLVDYKRSPRLDKGPEAVYNVVIRMRLNINNSNSAFSSNNMGGRSKTRQRQALLELIREAGGHIDAKELFRRAIEKDSSVSHATVYRSLNLFRELGLIDRKRLGKAQCYYEVKNSPEHQHLVCQRCGKVIEFACPLSETIEKVKLEQGFIVTRAEVYLEGYCSECNEVKEDEDGI